eukprot:752682-Hanusia_phi.AAC.1
MQHNWEQIINDEKTFVTGGLGREMAADEFEVWVCSYADACALLGDAFCYIYDEEKELFVPWDLQSKLELEPGVSGMR